MKTTITLSVTSTSFSKWILSQLVLFILLLSSVAATAGHPSNCHCDEGIELTATEECQFQTFTLEDAHKTKDLYSACYNNPKRDVWFNTTVPASGVLEIKGKTDSNPIIGITVYTNKCKDLEYYTCTAELKSGTDYLSISISDEALAGEVIYMRVSRGDSNKEGDFEICVQTQDKPENESSDKAILLSNESGVFEYATYNNAFASSTTDVSVDACGNYQGGDVWFRTAVPTSGKLIVNAKSEKIDPVLAMYTGTSESLTYKTCSAGSGGEAEIILEDPMLADEIVYLRVYADDDATGGEFEMLVLEKTQMDCSEALWLDADKALAEFDPYANRYLDATTESVCSNQASRGIWFTMDVPASGELTLESKASADNSVKPILKVYKGDCSGLEEVTCGYFNVWTQENTFGAKAEIAATDGLANQTIFVQLFGDNVSKGDVMNFSVHNPSFALPVDLIRFTANTVGSEVVLDWATATEDNNDYFLVEHSLDGKNFTPIDQVRGKGTTSETQQYTYVHTNPFFGQNYYRLKQVDFDGAFEYFDVVVASVQLAEEQFKVFPNPGFTKDVITLRWTEDLGAEKLELSITDAFGRNVYKEELNDFYTREATINCGEINMDSGIYFLQLSSQRQVIARRRFNLVGR
ncbi:MAG: T9SS type A sorting domain-containing protein [Saprospiraceae bacterium]